MLSNLRHIHRRIALLVRFGIGPTIAIFVVGIGTGALWMLMFPSLYLELSDRLSWRLNWPTLAQVQLEKLLTSVHLRGDPLIGSDTTLLFGDSHLHRIPVSMLRGPVENYAISGETAERLSRRLARYGSVRHAHRVILLTGRNDLSIGTSPLEIAASIERSLSLIPPTTSVAVLGVPPAIESEARAKARKETNVLIEKQCAARSRCEFVSLEVFADSQGQLQSRFDMGDNLHLNPDAYAKLVQILNGLR